MPSQRNRLAQYFSGSPWAFGQGHAAAGESQETAWPVLEGICNEALERTETPPPTQSKQWVQCLREAVEQLSLLAETKRDEFLRVARLEQDHKELKAQVAALRGVGSIVVPITTLHPEPFELQRDIPVVVQPTDDGYLATLFDAGLSITGDTQEEAVANLRNLIVDVFDELEEDEQCLGPHPARQLAVLRSLIKRRQP